MSFDRPSLSVRSLSALGAALTLGLVLTGTVAPAEVQRRPARIFTGQGCLPLSGDLSPAGDAFRLGFLSGLSEVPDSQFGWQWQWTDNGSSPYSAQAWMDTSSTHPDIRLAGLGPAMDGVRLRSDSTPCLLLGDGPPGPANTWHLWPTSTRIQAQLLGWLRGAPKPIAIVVAATGSWAEIVINGLRDSLPGLVILPHDLDNTRWDEEVKRLLETRPGTIVFWNRPHEASALLARRLALGVFRKAQLLVPEGTELPDSLHATVLSPVWQPSSPPDSLQCLRYRSWGWVAGKALAHASRLAIRDSISLSTALALVKNDSLELETRPNGWFPILSPSIPESGVAVTPRSTLTSP